MSRFRLQPFMCSRRLNAAAGSWKKTCLAPFQQQPDLHAGLAQQLNNMAITLSAAFQPINRASRATPLKEGEEGDTRIICPKIKKKKERKNSKEKKPEHKKSEQKEAAPSETDQREAGNAAQGPGSRGGIASKGKHCVGSSATWAPLCAQLGGSSVGTTPSPAGC